MTSAAWWPWCPQEGYLFTASLADNLRYGDPDADLERVESVAREARLEGDIRGFPDGYQTLVGERGITLSGGQRQRAALGRALMVDAPLLVLDDALASVDNNTAAAILSSIREQRDRTILMVSHQLSAAAACDRVLVLDDGRLVQQGRHQELLAEPGTLPPPLGAAEGRRAAAGGLIHTKTSRSGDQTDRAEPNELLT